MHNYIINLGTKLFREGNILSNSLEIYNSIINDFALLKYLQGQHIYLGNLFNRNRISYIDEKENKIGIPKELSGHIDAEAITGHQEKVFDNILNNSYYQNFITEQNIYGVLLDLYDIKRVSNFKKTLHLLYNSHYTYIMSGRHCPTYKICNPNIPNTNVKSCKRYCYAHKDTSTSHNGRYMDRSFHLIGNSIFLENKNFLEQIENNIDSTILYNKNIL